MEYDSQDFSELNQRLTDTARASFERAGVVAKNQGSPYVGTEHILLGVLAQNSSLGAKILAENGVTLDRVEVTLDLTAQQVVVAVIDNGLHADVLTMVRTAWGLAMESGQTRIGTEHIIYSMLLHREARATRLLRDMNVDLKSLRSSFEAIFDRQQSEAEQEIVKVDNHSNLSSSIKLMKRFGIDLTERAREGLLDPMIGRTKELARIITILGRRSKNNPALIGDPGVGKTAVIEGLAQRIADGEVPSFLEGKRIIQLDLASMVAGTKFRGQFEERLQKVLAIAKKHQEVILFIDELHLLVGAGSTEGSMDAANILKPALARGEVRVIGATTSNEYRKYIEKDTALSRRFQSVMVAEPSVDEAVQMVAGLGNKLSIHHQVKISEDTVRTAVELSERYVSDRFLPDKAIDVLDEAAALMRAEISPKPTQRQKLAQQIKRLAARLDAAVESQQFEQAAQYKMRMNQLDARVAALGKDQSNLPELSDVYLQRAISAITGIPVKRLTSSEARQLVKLERRLASRVLGQPEAISQVARAVRRSKAGLQRQAGPLGSFIFLGPTGVGKTELARVLADEVFGGKQYLIKIDMSEFSEKHTISRLIGAPAGYVGYDDGGTLTDQVRRKPYSVVLFDEIEKAHPDTLNILLQILEDGQLTDSQGRTVSFRQTIIILTSNVGADSIARGEELGFGSTNSQRMDKHIRNTRAARKELEEFLRPELLGRIENTIVFEPLTRAIAGKIFDQLTQDIYESVQKRGCTLKIMPSVKRSIVQHGFDQQSGVRRLYHEIQARLVDPLSEALLLNHDSGAVLTARLQKGKALVDVEDR